MAGWTFGKKLASGFSLAGVILILVATAGYRSTRQLIEVDKAVKHSQEVRRLLSDLLSGYQDAETGQRGFLLSGQEAYLEPYTAGLADIVRLDAQLTDLTRENPEQQTHLKELRRVGGERLAILARVVKARREAGLAAAQAQLLQGQGLETMRHVRAVIRRMDDTEASALDSKRKMAEQNAQTAISTIVYGSVLGTGLLAVAGWLMTSGMSRQIGSAVQQIRASSMELQAVATQQAVGSRQQATAMTEISTTLSELLTSSNQIAGSAQNVSQMAEMVTRATRQGSSTVERSRQSVQSVHLQVGRIVDNMLDLERKSTQIGSVTEIVAELAEQTNILAINATIEAIGTGEAGRRFVAVADEIRKLADRMGVSTKEIRNLIEEVSGAIHTTVMSTEAGAKSATEGVRQFDELTGSFQHIAEVVAGSVDASREIELSTRQQATAVEQVSLAVSGLTESARQTEASSAQTLQTATHLSRLSLELHQIVSAAAA